MRRVLTSFAFVAVAGLALAGCSGSPLLDKDTYSQMFHKKIDLFATPEWAQADTSANNIHLTPKGPVPPEDLVTADGRCAPPVAATPASAEQQTAQGEQQATQAQQPAKKPTPQQADRRVGSIAGDLAGAPMPQGPTPAATTGSAPPPDRLVPEGRGGMRAPAMAPPPVLGGIALGMTECQVVRRAGTPNNVTIGSGAKGVRKVVLSYLGGEWPGIYQFRSGRLKVIEATPQQAKPATAKSTRKARKRAARRKASGRTTERYYVQ